MKLYIKLITLLSFIVFSSSLFAQNDKPTSYIKTVTQYKAEDNTVELRFIADKRSVFYAGVKNGFIIERAEITSKIEKKEDIKYKQIATVTAFTEEEWSQAMQTTNLELKKNLEMAKVFLEAMKNPKKKNPKKNFNEIIQQKKAEDFEFVLMVLSAIQKEKVADALGLGYKDKTVKKNTKYVYRVKPAKYSGPYTVIGVPYLITTKKKSKELLRKIDINVGDTQLGFSWEENDMVSGALVEKKNKITGKFEPLNDKPKYSLSQNSFRNGFEDKNLVNYQQYEYRFYGFNAFGEKILFGEVKAMPRDLTPPKSPLMKSAKHTKPAEVTVEWDMATPVETDLKGFTIMHGTEVDGEFKKISTSLLSKSTRTYTDNNFIKNGKNYYVVQAIDTAGNISRSFSSYATLIDTIAPMIPKFSSGKIDSTGVVTLKIAPSKDQDLMGYRLFMANNPEHEFSAIQEGFDSRETNPEPPQHTFNDTITLKSLSPYVYYKVKALDFHHNQSDFSPIYKIKRIDTIPPTTPVFKNVIVGENTIELSFALSKSKDVKSHFLYRKPSSESNWKKIAKIDSKQTVYIDKNLQKSKNYYYSLRAMDDSNLFSEYAVSVKGRPYDDGNRPKVEDFTLRKSKDKYVLSWIYPTASKDTFFIVYKSNKDGDLVQYKRTEKLSFSEKNTKNKNSYAIRAFTKDGGSSKMSTIVSIP
jgi:hypothetical protein